MRRLHVVLPREDPRPLLLFLNYTGIGDLVLALPLLRALRPRFRAVPVVPPASREVAGLLHEDGALEGYAVTRGALRADRHPLAFLRACRELSRLRAAELVVYGRTAFGWAARSGLLRGGRSLFCSPRGTAPPAAPAFEVLASGGNRTRDYLRIAERLGAPGHGTAFRLSSPLRDRLRRLARSRVPWSDYAVVSSWTNEPRKDAPPRFFREGLEALVAAGLPVVLTGLPRNRGAMRALRAGAPGGRTVDLVGATSLPELLGLLAGARVLLASEGGTLHLARMVGTPVIGAFGPSTPESVLLDTAGLEAIRADVPCSPCESTARRFRCPGARLECLERLEVSAVSRALVRSGAAQKEGVA
jgi:ADP-heptose:LPS heptosyltransferase